MSLARTSISRGGLLEPIDISAPCGFGEMMWLDGDSHRLCHHIPTMPIRPHINRRTHYRSELRGAPAIGKKRESQLQLGQYVSLAGTIQLPVFIVTSMPAVPSMKTAAHSSLNCILKTPRYRLQSMTNTSASECVIDTLITWLLCCRLIMYAIKPTPHTSQIWIYADAQFSY